MDITTEIPQLYQAPEDKYPANASMPNSQKVAHNTKTQQDNTLCNSALKLPEAHLAPQLKQTRPQLTETYLQCISSTPLRGSP